MFNEQELAEINGFLSTELAHGTIMSIALMLGYTEAYGNPVIFVFSNIATKFSEYKETTDSLALITEKREAILQLEAEISEIEHGKTISTD